MSVFVSVKGGEDSHGVVHRKADGPDLDVIETSFGWRLFQGTETEVLLETGVHSTVATLPCGFLGNYGVPINENIYFLQQFIAQVLCPLDTESD